MIGLPWLGHHQLFSALRRISAPVVMTDVVLLGPVALLPFPSSTLADYGDEPLAVITCAGDVGSLALVQAVIVGIASRARAFGFRPSAPSAFATSAVSAALLLPPMPSALLSPKWTSMSWLLLVPAQVVVDRFRKCGPEW